MNLDADTPWPEMPDWMKPMFPDYPPSVSP